jgi:ATP-dependent RNA helicase DDX43
LQVIPPELTEMAQRFEAMKQRRREEGGGDRRGGGGRGGGFGGRGRRGNRHEGINFPMYGIA